MELDCQQPFILAIEEIFATQPKSLVERSKQDARCKERTQQSLEDEETDSPACATHIPTASNSYHRLRCGGTAVEVVQISYHSASEPASVSPTPVVDPAWARVLKEAEDHKKTPFRGITEAGKVEEGLYSIRSTGVSTKPVQLAAQRFLDGLDAGQKKLTQFDIQSVRWRQWSNTHRYPRVGVSFGQLSDHLAPTGLWRAQGISQRPWTDAVGNYH